MELKENKVKEIADKIKACEGEIGKGIIGQKDIVQQVLMVIFSGGNVLLEGVPGLGKTQLVKTISQVLDLDFSRIQFTPDLMPADVVGTNLIIKEGNENKFKFEKGPIFSNMVLADEINRATPKTQSALLEAMQEKTVTVGKQTNKLSEPFMVLATQNPIENEGTYPLPEAQLDRFMFKLNVEFPSLNELKEIMDLTVSSKKVEINSVMNGNEIIEIRELMNEIIMADAVKEFALKLVMFTHPTVKESPEVTKKYVEVGASPRGGQAIFAAARVKALLEGRLNVAFDDIRFVAYPALRHRLVLNYEAIAEGLTADGIIKDILDSVSV